MQWYEILTIVLVILFFIAIIGRYIYKKKKGLPTGECACCQVRSKRFLKAYKKAFPPKSSLK